MRRFVALAVLAFALVASACAPVSRFEWGSYEGTLYAYSKKPENRDAYRASLVSAIQRGEATDRVAPGLNAELGYLFMEDGQTAEAIQYFETEKRLFPESARFMDGVITRLRSNGAAGAHQ